MNNNSIHPVSFSITPTNNEDTLISIKGNEISGRKMATILIAGAISGATLAALTGYIDRKYESSQNPTVQPSSQPEQTCKQKE